MVPVKGDWQALSSIFLVPSGRYCGGGAYHPLRMRPGGGDGGGNANVKVGSILAVQSLCYKRMQVWEGCGDEKKK
jgi:hypothetical protein